MQAINRMDWTQLKHEYDLDAKRLLPWEGVVAPFGGAWCVVRPGTRSLPHAHMEREIFICIDGNADVVLDGKPHPLKKGDVVAVPPGSEHFIQNDSGNDFHMYCIFWDKDAATNYLQEEVL
ncbi:cupin domain-containing protein [Noviherbaspirillum denitrificans]|uniref:Cupin n=1 Tax=Noviherbaspirillum denitrificans TaxID=1968433 RepID=A0A254TPD4_9BURK|nr:cupin domain-containing protein [Noviherbaspirillum denitrificans]OWW21578.1 cupin [Noviherbaspirillum denitrificans]